MHYALVRVDFGKEMRELGVMESPVTLSLAVRRDVALEIQGLSPGLQPSRSWSSAIVAHRDQVASMMGQR